MGGIKGEQIERMEQACLFKVLALPHACMSATKLHIMTKQVEPEHLSQRGYYS